MFAFPQPHYMACRNCGAAIARGEAASHECEPERRLNYLLLQARGELSRIDEEFAEYLRSPHGRFDAWYAARRR